jgi:hypothetical protein
MCCEPGHLGPPPEWHREAAGEVISEGCRPPRVTAAEGLAALASVIHPGHQRGSGPGRRAVSTEGGHGRALCTFPFSEHGEREDDWGRELRLTSRGAENLTNNLRNYPGDI